MPATNDYKIIFIYLTQERITIMAHYEIDDKVIDDIKLSVDILEDAFEKIAALYKKEVNNEQFETLLTILDRVEFDLVNKSEVVSFRVEI